MNGDFKEQVTAKTDEELKDIYINSDDYQDAFVKAVSEEMLNRKISVDAFRPAKDQKAKSIQEQFEMGREGNKFFIGICFVSALLGGIIGIVAGLIYNLSMHKNGKGTKYYVYDKQTRQWGRAMVIVGMVVLLLTLAWRFD